MRVFAGQTVGQLVGMRLAEHVRAGIEQTLHRGRGDGCRRMCLEPFRAAEAGAMACDVVYILRTERVTRKRPPSGSGAFDVSVVAERIDVVAIEYGSHDRILLPEGACARALVLPQPREQLVVNAAKAAIAHDEYLIAGLGGITKRRDQPRDVVMNLDFAAQRRKRRGDIPG